MFACLYKCFSWRPGTGRRCTAAGRASLHVVALEERTLMTAGALDLSFGTFGDGKADIPFAGGAQPAEHAAATAVQSDGKIVVVGWAQGPNGDHDFAIARLNANGVADQSFGIGGTVRVPFNLGGGNQDEANAVVIQGDGKIVVAGTAQRSGGGDFDMAVVRLNPDGSLDTTGFQGGNGLGKTVVPFNTGGDHFDAAYAVAMNGDRIVLAGSARTGPFTFDMAVAQLNYDGSFDANFSFGGNDGGNGRLIIPFNGTSRANAVAMQGNKILVAGGTGVFDMAVARLYGISGDLDGNFGAGGQTTVAFNLGGNNVDTANAMAVQPDGKIVLVGTADRPAGDRDFAIARLEPGGALDVATFGTGGKTTVAFNMGGSMEDSASAVVLQPDGKIVVAGTVQRIGATDTDYGVARLTPGGDLDSTFAGGSGKGLVAFNQGQGNTDSAAGVALEPGGRIVVAGTIQQPSAGNTDFAVVRLLGDPPQAPMLTSPTTPVALDQGTFLIQGGAAAGSLVRVYRDVNANNQLDPGIDTVVGQQQLVPLNTAYAIAVPLTQNAANHFLVTATAFNSESPATVVSTITDVDAPPASLQPLAHSTEGIVTRVVRRKGKSVVEVRGAARGELRRTFGPYAGRARALLRDVNQDGMLDLVIQTTQRGKKDLRVYDGLNLTALPLPSKSKR